MIKYFFETGNFILILSDLTTKKIEIKGVLNEYLNDRFA